MRIRRLWPLFTSTLPYGPGHPSYVSVAFGSLLAPSLCALVYLPKRLLRGLGVERGPSDSPLQGASDGPPLDGGIIPGCRARVPRVVMWRESGTSEVSKKTTRAMYSSTVSWVRHFSGECRYVYLRAEPLEWLGHAGSPGPILGLSCGVRDRGRAASSRRMPSGAAPTSLCAPRTCLVVAPQTPQTSHRLHLDPLLFFHDLRGGHRQDPRTRVLHQ